MAPPTQFPRLDQLDPLVVAGEACELVLDHVARYAVPLSPGVTLDLRGDMTAERAAASTGIGLTVQDLTRYAQRGELGDWPDASCAEDALIEVCSALYGCAGEPGTFGLGELEGETDIETPIGVVLVAAHGRWRVAMRQAVTVKAVAALASLSVNAIDALIKDGEIRLASEKRPRTIAPKEARRFLGARGVPGF